MIRRQPQTGPINANPEAVQITSAPQQVNLPLGVDPMMISSLPPMASGADVYARQFYRDFRLPSRRYLPLKGL